MICCGTISLKCRTVGLIRATGLKALGTFTAFGLCSRFRWASVVGRAFSRVMPASGGRVGDNTPSRMATYSEKVGMDIPVFTPSARTKRNGSSRSPQAGVMGPSFRGFSFQLMSF